MGLAAGAQDGSTLAALASRRPGLHKHAHPTWLHTEAPCTSRSSHTDQALQHSPADLSQKLLVMSSNAALNRQAWAALQQRRAQHGQQLLCLPLCLLWA